MAFSKTKLKAELLTKIDKDSQQELEKVDRYLALAESYHKLTKHIKKTGEMELYQNGSQQVLRANPAIKERNAINTNLIALEKSFNPIPDQKPSLMDMLNNENK